MNFLDLPPERSARERSAAVVLPLPYEGTVSFGAGTSGGPAAIIAASREVEFYDHALGDEPCRLGIHTARALELEGLSPETAHRRIEEAAGSIVAEGRLVVALGGEHSVSPPVVAAVRAGAHDEVTALVIDAHLDLRDRYQGSRLSHACASRRMHEGGPVVIVGARAFERAEFDFARDVGIPVVLASEIAEKGMEACLERIVDACTPSVYLSFDVDGLDPSIMPSTGTPVPGGIGWYDALCLIRAVARRRRIVGLDVVELSPIDGLVAPDFLAAKLTYSLIGGALLASTLERNDGRSAPNRASERTD